ncbi:MAG TPA: carboxypeptidase-like regulatory domain-containing protein, partial [Chitinophagaceae bacterium]
MLKKPVLLLLVSFFVLFAAAQKVTVKVVDAKTGDPLANATVKLRNSGKGGTTDASGVYEITAASGATIEVSEIGYATKSVSVNGSQQLVVSLDPVTLDLSDIVVLGTRSGGRAKTETAVPVDVIRINQAGLSTAKMELTSVLNFSAPSFNYNKQSGADGADHIDLGTLRGLGPDQTLVLINGKRRHQTAFVGLFGTR